MSAEAVSKKTYPEQISIGAYILERLAQLQVTSLFGVPGDYNLAFLDLVEDHESIQWVGNANELNAAYATDGNARVKRGVSALCTTFGVGELSALNGIAGCYSERIPVLHIVGVPSVSLQKGHALLHHTLGDGNFHAFEQMSKNISCATTWLESPHRAGEEIDRTLVAMLTECRPAYLGLPSNLVASLIPSESLTRALPPSASSPHPLLVPSEHLSSQTETRTPAASAAVKAIVSLFAAAQNPIVLVDALAERFGAENLVKDLVNATGMKVFVSPMGKGCIDERWERFGGVYAGSVTLPKVLKLVEKADLVIDVGPLKSDFNTGSFSYGIKHSQTVELYGDHTVVGYADFPGVGLVTLLPLLTEAFSAHLKAHHPNNLHLKSLSATPSSADLVKDAAAERKTAEVGDESTETSDSTEAITHNYLWPRVGKFFEEGDVIVAETGTSSFGILDSVLPKNATLASQVLWGSIGWSVGATLGAAFAAREQGRRTICFVGDGSLQLTVQEIGTMIRHELKPILFVLNNDGYEIERQIHGEKRIYNNIPRWNHQLLLSSLSPSSDANTFPSNSLSVDIAKMQAHKSYRVSTRQEFDALLKDESFKKAEVIQLVEIVMPRGDAPRALLTQAKLSAKANQA